MTADTIEIPFAALPVDKAACLSELGYGEACPDFVRDAIDEAIAEAGALSSARAGWRFIDEKDFALDLPRFVCGDITLTPSEPVARHATGTVTIAAVVGSAGPGIESRSRDLLGGEDPLKGFILDWIGSQVADQSGRAAVSAIRNIVAARGWKSTPLFSPGTCGWDIVDQQNLFKLFPDRFLGISLTASSLMRPIKSVSGIVGLGPDVDDSMDLCSVCGFEKCHNKKNP
jgi:hypothetical protein